MKKISIIGSTGSIGTQGLEVIRKLKDIEVIGLSTNTKIQLLSEQIIEFNPKIVSVKSEKEIVELKSILKEKKYTKDLEISFGAEGLNKIAEDESKILITAVVGIVGLIPTIKAIKKGKIIGLANKETMVTAGDIILRETKKSGSIIIPVDSEHSAIFQCLNGEKREEVEKILLTASGGPFRGKKLKDLKNIDVSEALNHPNWSMGSKISIDSSTMINKGLEVIEAKWLFDIETENIDVIVHPESIIHSMVEYVDGSIIAHLGTPDMRIPIQYAITYPNRLSTEVKKLDLTEIGKLNFEKPDLETFKGLKLSIEASKIGGTMPTVLNSSNEVLVEAFLNRKIGYLDIVNGIEEAMNSIETIYNPKLEDVLEIDLVARNFINRKID